MPDAVVDVFAADAFAEADFVGGLGDAFTTGGLFGTPAAPLGAAASSAATRDGARAWTPDALRRDHERFVSGTPVTAMPAVGAVRPAELFHALLPDFATLPALTHDASAVAGLSPAEATRLAFARAAERQREQQERAAAERAAAERAARAAAEAERQAAEQALADADAEAAAAGRAEAEAELQGAFGGALAALESASEALRTHEERWLLHLEENVAALAVAVASRLVPREVAADPSVAVTLARAAIAEFPMDEPLTLRAHPDDLVALRAALEDPDRAAGRRALRWTPDARVLRGGVLAEGRERIVDGRVDAALERMYRAMAKHHA